MARSVKRSDGVEEKRHEHGESEVEALQRALQAARGEVMRAQRDLEAARLEQAEQRRRHAQQAMVASEALKEARAERNHLRTQLDALRAEMTGAARKRRRDGPAEENQAFDEAQAELAEAREKLAAAEEDAASARSASEEALAQVVACRGRGRS